MIIFSIILLAIVSTAKSAAPSPRCPSNMVQYYQNSHICYWFVSTPASFDDAKKTCVKNGGHLAPVFDQPTNFFIAQTVYKTLNSTDFWIGGKTNSINDATVWLWTWYYAYFVFTDWSPGQGKPIPSNCVLSNSKTALWSSADCSTAKPFACQIPAIIDVCDSGWSYFDETKMCYKYISQPKITFPNAQSICSSQNANLVSIHSKKENDFVINMTQDATAEKLANEGTFIGLQYINSEWKWVDGTDFDYENWGPDRPQYVANVKIEGVFVYPDGASDVNGVSDPATWSQKWDDWKLDIPLNRFVCKKKPNLMFVGENLNINI